MITVAVLCGGPSLERGISLNSARSVLDHLASKAVEVVPIYIDARRRAYKVSKAQLYSNTPSDFDFKLQQAGELLNRSQLIALLKSVDLTFPVMHGAFAEDGEIQRLLEKHHIPFVGSSSAACMACFDKFNSNQFIRERGFATLPSALLERGVGDHGALIRAFFKQHQIKRAVVKPASGGSSIGVFSVGSPEEALAKAEFLFAKRMDSRVVLEQFAQGFEFTVIILQNRFGLPVALPPTEIETSYEQHQIFDFRKKYLPTRQVIWHCPPRFADEVIEKIQAQAEQLFAAFGMRDFARFDGWVLPDGRIWFCDFNPISGMEQNSFLFQQGARIGLTHADTLRHVVGSACRRYGLTLPELPVQAVDARQPVQVLFGGNSSEREVSLMSGSNVWLKLRKSERFAPQAFVLDGSRVWHVPYHLVLNHTVEEVIDNCKHYPQAKKRLEQFENRVRIRLGLLAAKNPHDFFAPTVMSLQQFVQQAPFVFIGLHGGKGEDGTLQGLLQEYKVPHNGSSARVSRLCMDKWATSQLIAKLKIPGVVPIPGQVVATRVLLTDRSAALEARWQALQQALGSSTIVVKPRADGCSSGVVRLNEWQDLQRYVDCIAKGLVSIPAGTFSKQRDPIEMPPHAPAYLLFERYVATDMLRVQANRLKYVQKTGWLEVTMGVMAVNGELHGLNPSITVAEGEVLTVEEKFQGGTGVNITPPPAELVKPAILKLIKERIVAVATQVGIEGYARIDAFIHLKTGEVMIIEINTLPGLTPSTVFFHQGLAEHPQLYPTQLLERLVENKLSRA